MQIKQGVHLTRIENHVGYLVLGQQLFLGTLGNKDQLHSIQ